MHYSVVYVVMLTIFRSSRHGHQNSFLKYSVYQRHLTDIDSIDASHLPVGENSCRTVTAALTTADDAVTMITHSGMSVTSS
jgi:hypothetical protein